MIETQLGNLSQPGHVSANTSCNPPHMSSLTAQRWNGTRGKFSRLKLQRQALRQRTARADGANGTRYTAVCDLAFHFSNAVRLHRYGCGFSLLGLSVAVRFAASELAAPMSGGGRSPSAVIAMRVMWRRRDTPAILCHIRYRAPNPLARGAEGCSWRRRSESNRRTGLCRPLPKPLGHAAVRAGRSA